MPRAFVYKRVYTLYRVIHSPYYTKHLIDHKLGTHSNFDFDASTFSENDSLYNNVLVSHFGSRLKTKRLYLQ